MNERRADGEWHPRERGTPAPAVVGRAQNRAAAAAPPSDATIEDALRRRAVTSAKDAEVLRAIRDHVDEGRDLQLFEANGTELEYIGEFATATTTRRMRHR